MKSTAERTYNAIKARPVGATFAVRSIANSLGRTQGDNGVAAFCSKMHTKGYLDRTGKGLYRVNGKTHEWERVHSFRGKNNTENTATAATIVQMPPGNDVLQSLLDAMAAAEPEIRRLMEQDKHVRELAKRYTM